MKLRNKKTGKIVEVLANPTVTEFNKDLSIKNSITFNSLAELNEEWEDYAEDVGWNWWYNGIGIILFKKGK